jgi:hypothetical protein
VFNARFHANSDSEHLNTLIPTGDQHRIWEEQRWRAHSHTARQLVLAVQGRANLIFDRWRARIYRYITGIGMKKTCNLIIVNGMPDRLLVRVGLSPGIPVGREHVPPVPGF